MAGHKKLDVLGKRYQECFEVLQTHYDTVLAAACGCGTTGSWTSNK